MSKKAILCVDDEVIIILSLIQELKFHLGDDYRIESAVNPKEAIAVIEDLKKEEYTDIMLISDWLMPGVNGNEFLLTVKDRYPAIKTVLITGQANENIIEKIIVETGVLSVLTKPWNSKELLDSVKICFEYGIQNY
jgi:DNA-binding NtrC family response regulator